jgi:phage tail-like protein
MISSLESPQPLGPSLPAIYQDDELVQRFLSAFDVVLAPVFCTLDNLAAYLDPSLAPVDFLDWLAGWVGLVLDENWPLARRREMASRAAELYRWRGTVRGLAAAVALSTGVDPDVEESGGTAWSPTPGAELPGNARNHVTVRLRAPDPSAINLPRLDALVSAGKPANVTHAIEVVPA